MALSPGEQALVAKGQPVTSSFIPAESRARINAAIQAQQSSAPAISQQDIQSRIQQIQSAGGGDTAETRAQIAREAQQFGVTPEQLGVATGLSSNAIRDLASQAGQSFPSTTGGMLTSGQTTRTVTPASIQMPALSSVTEMSDPAGLIQSIYQSELGRTLGSVEDDQGALDYWTNRLQSGATPEDIRREIEGTPEGLVYDAYTGLLGRAPDETGRDYWVGQLTAGDLTPEQVQQNFLQSEEFLGPVATIKSKTPLEAMTGAIDTGSVADLGSLFYWSRQNNQTMPSELIEQIGYSRSQDKDTAYNFAVGAQAYSEGLEALDQAIQSGDTNKAAELRDALANESTFWTYYNENIAENEGQAHGNLRNQTASGNVFGIGDPGEYQKSFWDDIGDAIGDVAENPFVQAAVTFVNPAAGAVLNAYATLDSGDDLTPQQIIAAATGAAELANLPTGTAILDQLPKGIRDFAQSVQDFTEGKIDNAVAALKRAFPDVDTKKLAGYEDVLKETLASGEDFIREVVGDENIEAISGGFAGFEDAARDLFEGQFGGIESRLGGLEELLAGLAAERGGSGFSPQRGYQPGLPVDTQFDTDGRSLVLEILNQPSSVQRTA